MSTSTTPPLRGSRNVASALESNEARADFGQWLRQQREMREISLAEVAQATNVGVRYFEALEEGRFELLPAPVFARGFLREYARYVGLDPDEVTNSYLTALAPGREDAVARSAVHTPEWRMRVAAVAAAVGLLVLIGGLWWWARQPGVEAAGDSLETRPAVQANEVDRPATPAAPVLPQSRSPAVGSAPLTVTVDFRSGTWIDAEIDGVPRISEERLQGESLTLEAQERVLLIVAQPRAVDVLVNGEPRALTPDPDGGAHRLEIVLTEPEAARSVE